MERHEYIILGIAITEEEANELYEYTRTQHEPGELILLSDKLHNDYHIFGRVVAIGEEHLGLPFRGYDLISLSQWIPQLMQDIDNTNVFKLPAQIMPIKLYPLTHFTK